MARSPKPWYRRDRKAWFVTIDGKRHNLGRDRKSAFQRFHELMARPAKRTVSTQSVAGIFDTFLDWTLKHRSPRTYDWYRERCQWFLKAAPKLDVDQFQPYHVQEWVDSNPNWSDGHKRGCIVAIQRPFRWAQKMGYIERNPIAHLEKPQSGRRDQCITEREYQEIIEAIPDNEFRELLQVAWECGPRPQELLRVEARHVDLKNGRWLFPKEEAKGKRRARVVYLTETAIEITTRLMLKHPEGPLFRNTQVRPWKPCSANCRFHRLKKKLGTKYCLYAFRHSYATRLLQSGVDALTVAVLMGHSDTSMLGKVYQHLSHNPSHLREQLGRARKSS